MITAVILWIRNFLGNAIILCTLIAVVLSLWEVLHYKKKARGARKS